MPASPGGMIIRSTCGPRSSLTAALWLPCVDDALHPRQRGEALDEGRRVIGLRQQVQVADRLAAASEGPGRHDRAHTGDARERRRPAPRPTRRPDRGASAAARAVQRGDARQDRCLRSLRQAADGPKATGLGRPPEILDRFDAERFVEQLDRLRPDARHLEELDRASAGTPPAVARGTPGGRSRRARRACR